MPLQLPAVLDRSVKNRTLKKVSLPVSVEFQYRLLTAPERIPERTLSTPLYINARDYLTNRYVGDEDGDTIYPHIRDALLHGRKVTLSVRGVSAVGDFFKTAICRAYGEFPESTVDGFIEVVDMTESESASLEEMKEFSKLYYYDRPAYDEWVSAWEKVINDETEIVSDDEIEPLAPDEDLASAITIDELMVRLHEGWRERDKKVSE